MKEAYEALLIAMEDVDMVFQRIEAVEHDLNSAKMELNRVLRKMLDIRDIIEPGASELDDGE